MSLYKLWQHLNTIQTLGADHLIVCSTTCLKKKFVQKMIEKMFIQWILMRKNRYKYYWLASLAF